MPEITVILPTYNEAGNIEPLLEELIKVFTSHNKTYEIIVVDDNSPDGTANLVTQISQKYPQVKLFVRTIDPGLGRSIGFGVLKAKGDIIIGMDADFNHRPDVIPSLLTALTKAELVIASRFIKNGGMSNRFRYVATLGFNTFLRSLGFASTDNLSGFYAIRRSDLLALKPEHIYYGYGDYHLRLVYYAGKKGYRIKEVPVFYGDRKYGISKSKLFHMLCSYSKEAIRLRLNQA